VLSDWQRLGRDRFDAGYAESGRWSGVQLSGVGAGGLRARLRTPKFGRRRIHPSQENATENGAAALSTGFFGWRNQRPEVARQDASVFREPLNHSVQPQMNTDLHR
jgi:hypothetical protein